MRKARIERTHILCLFSLLVCSGFAGEGLGSESLPEGSRQLRLERIDGSMLAGVWLGMEPSTGLRLQTGGGVEVVQLNDVASIDFEDQHQARAARGNHAASEAELSGTPVELLLPYAGRLVGRLVRSGADSIVATTVLGVERSFPFDRLAAVRFEGDDDPQAGERFASAFAQRLPGQDVLITRSADGAKTVRGRIVELGAEEGSFDFGDRVRLFKNSKIFGVVFAAGAVLPAREPVDCEMIDGTRFSGQLRSADARRIHMATSVGFAAEIDLSRVARITMHSPRVLYLSDMVALAEDSAGLLHTPSPMRKNRSVARRPLSIDGRVFDRGLGVHSRTALEYRLGGEFKAFAATIGIDDWVRPRGSVVFRVLDGRGDVLFDSGEVTGRVSGRDILVDVTGAERLVLLVDYGEALDVSDHADWGGARLIRKASP